MKRAVLSIVASGAMVVGACSSDGLSVDAGRPSAPAADMTVLIADMNTVPPPQDDLAVELTLCGDQDPICQVAGLGPENNKPFPLPTDTISDPVVAVAASGVGRDGNGWLVRNIDAGTTTYSVIFRSGCFDSLATNEWYTVAWNADVPAGTSLTLHARSGRSSRPDQTWGQWTSDYRLTPVDLTPPGVLVPNGLGQGDAYYLQVEFTFRGGDPKATPALKSFAVAYKCTLV